MSILGTFIVGAAVAQDQIDQLDSVTFGRLTVRPREAATATRTTHAGLQALSLPLPHYDNGSPEVYVPAQCVGARRCPLLMYSQPDTPDWLMPVADQYGVLLLFVDARLFKDTDLILETVLATFAVDPDKIALYGRCATAPWSVKLAANNLSVFSRVAIVSGPYTSATPAVDPPNGQTEFFLAEGINEPNGAYETARALRALGYPVKLQFQVRGHEWHVEEMAALGRWLQESWAVADPARRAAPDTVPEVLLTTEALAKMTDFWTCFMQMPDSI